ncbi:MAG: hypothetical protein MJ117_00460 [Lachnospiraceae bacterium]|nr:hypothetical protein [Lachnospiraceae bacterium]
MGVLLSEKLFTSVMNCTGLDEFSLRYARDRFLALQSEGVIKDGCSFDDDVWQTTDLYSNVGLYFTFSRFSYARYGRLFGLSFDEFVIRTKAYIISLFGQKVLQGMENTLLDIRHLLDLDPESVCGEDADLRLYSVNRLSDFLILLVNEDNEEQMDRLTGALEAYADINSDSGKWFNQRELADFDSYFEFNDILSDYWKRDLPNGERFFYYPLYLWWNLTAVIPVRPREFLLTERDCLSIGADGRYRLKIRRNLLKGGAGNERAYNICDAYLSQPLTIPDRLGKLFEEYIRETEKYERTDIDTLFVTDPHYSKWGQKKHKTSRFLTYTNMNTILRYFYRDVVSGTYGYKVLYDGGDADHAAKEIRYIHLGDARHHAFINLMQEGATPVTAMLLGGHSNIEMASHYYSNVSSLIECQTYRQYRKLIGSDREYRLSRYTKTPPAVSVAALSDGSGCSSDGYRDRSYSDCINALGPDGEIGYCPVCPFHSGDGSGFSKDDIYKRRIEEDGKELYLAVRALMEEKGNMENIQEAIMRLNTSSYSYKAYLREKLTKEMEGI